MPQYNSYPEIASLLDDDIVLVWQDSTQANKTISFGNLSSSLDPLLGEILAPASLAALRGQSVADKITGAVAIVSAYSTANDGGGGVFVYNSASVTADNDGTIIAPSVGAGRWFRVYSGPIVAEWFGAKGNGVDDDTAKITAAISAAGSGGTVQLTAGKVYVTTSVITIPANGVIIRGYGAIITSGSESQYQKFLFSSRSRGGVYGVRFDCLYSAMATSIGAGVIKVLNSNDISIRDCEFNDVAQSGVYVLGSSDRCVITNNKFYRNFCAIFSDDNTVVQPTKLLIQANEIRSGLGATGTNLSGAVKISGTGTVNSTAGHVISDNIIESPGQMGIEMQTWVNDCTISGNTINGAGFGISISGCANTAITGNNVRGSVTFGIELSGAIRASVSGGVVCGLTSAGAATAGIGIGSNSSCSNISMAGVNINGHSGDALDMTDTVMATVSGCFVNGFGSSGINIKNSSSIAISGNTIKSGAAGNYFIFINSNDATCSDIVISGNIMSGNVASNGILLYHPANFIQDMLISDNRFTGTAPGFFLATSGAGSDRRIRTRNNYGSGANNFTTNPGLDVYNTAVAMTLGWAVKRVNADATGGAFAITLPDSTNMIGEIFGVVKTDAFNNVTVNTTGGQTINGAATVVLAAQYKRVTVQSNGTGWIVIESN